MWTNSSQASISIHALREEGDRRGQQARGVTKVFLSTPSARRATLEWHLAYYSSLISIHALREEGDSIRPHGQRVDAISIHALREEGDLEGVARDVRANISIHALREEGDRRPPFC